MDQEVNMIVQIQDGLEVDFKFLCDKLDELTLLSRKVTVYTNSEALPGVQLGEKWAEKNWHSYMRWSPAKEYRNQAEDDKRMLRNASCLVVFWDKSDPYIKWLIMQGNKHNLQIKEYLI